MCYCTVFALFYFGLIESNFRVEATGGNHRRFYRITSLGGLYLERFLHGGAYFTEFYGF